MQLCVCICAGGIQPKRTTTATAAIIVVTVIVIVIVIVIAIVIIVIGYQRFSANSRPLCLLYVKATVCGMRPRPLFIKMRSSSRKNALSKKSTVVQVFPLFFVDYPNTTRDENALKVE